MNITRRWFSIRLRLAGPALVIVLVLANLARAAFIVSPSQEATTYGNGNNAAPFDIGNASSMRYQQVYAASEFSAIASPMLITQIAFRPDAGAFTGTLPSVRIDLSTTNRAPDALSNTFATNVGPDDTIVFPASALTLSSTGSTLDFDIVINFATPFLYDAANGNLLLDVRNFNGGLIGPINAEFNAGDGVFRVWTGLEGNNVGQISGVTDTYGLVTRFTVSAVPEPSTFILLGFALFGLLGYGIRRRLTT